MTISVGTLCDVHAVKLPAVQFSDCILPLRRSVSQGVYLYQQIGKRAVLVMGNMYQVLL